MTDPEGLYRGLKGSLKDELVRLDTECAELIRALEARLELMNVLVDMLRRVQDEQPPVSDRSGQN